MTFIPLAGAIVIMLVLPKTTQEKVIGYVSIIFSLPSLLISLLLWMFYDDSGGYFAIEKFSWIPAINVNYHLGIDGR
jgi:NADH-quinone oxidoreductase subunit M